MKNDEIWARLAKLNQKFVLEELIETISNVKATTTPTAVAPSARFSSSCSLSPARFWAKIIKLLVVETLADLINV